MKIPNTLISGKKKDLIKFYEEHHFEGIICKRIIDNHFYNNGEHTFNFGSTFLIDSNLLETIPDYFALSLFQEKISIDFEIRTIYLNGEFHTASIHNFKDENDEKGDFDDPSLSRVIPFKLPKSIEIKLELTFQSLNMNYGSADLIYSKGEFYFLEINPSGQIGFVNEACNFYLEKKISELLKNEE